MASWFSPSPYPSVDSETSAVSTARGSARVDHSTEPSVNRGLDNGLVLGLVIAAAAVLAGIGATGIDLGYFFQPTGALIVIGGTLGVTLISTPRAALTQAIRRARALLRPESSGEPDALIEEILDFARTARNMGILQIEPTLPQVRNGFLRQVLAMAMDVKNRTEFRAALDTMLRIRERQGETDAKVLENAGGFAPTIGVLGTVVGLIDALRHFSDLANVSAGVGTAFVSTLYGLALANLVLLPAAHRIRATAESDAHADELIGEGVLGIYDSVHPTLLRDRLQGFVRHVDDRTPPLP